MLESMDDRPSKEVYIAPGPPLLRAGFEQAVNRAGLVAGLDLSAPIGLRAGGPPASQNIDVAVAPEGIAVRVVALPSREEWDAVFDVIHALFDLSTDGAATPTSLS